MRITPKQSITEGTIVASGDCVRDGGASKNRWDQQGKMLVVEASDSDYASRNTELSHWPDPCYIPKSRNEHNTPPFKVAIC